MALQAGAFGSSRSDGRTASSKGRFLVEVQVKSYEKGARKREIKGEENDG